MSKDAPPSAWEPKHDFGGGRAPLRIEVFSHAVGAKRGATIFASFRDAHRLDPSDPQWLHEEEVDTVKIVLLRWCSGQLDAAALRAAFKGKGTDFKNKKQATKKADRIVKALAAYLATTDGPASKSTFEGAAAALAEAEAATAEELEALIDHFHERLRAQRLTEPEVIATRLYTGPGYVKLNASLRMASGRMPEWMTAHLQGNRYTNAIYLCASGMRKIAGASRIPRGRKVFRGMAGFRLPHVFVEPGEDGARGGAEFAFMSCTTNRAVAVSYINTAKARALTLTLNTHTLSSLSHSRSLAHTLSVCVCLSLARSLSLSLSLALSL